MDLPDPVGQQKVVVTLTRQGHVIVLGTAGSGKTTMAVHRAQFLANPATEHGGPTLLLTFNRALLAYFDALGANDMAGVTVENYHKFARGYLASQGRMGPYGCIVHSEPQRERLIDQALKEVRGRHGEEGVLGRPQRFFHTELRWMAEHGYLTRESYLAADRVGRGQALEGTGRERVFQVYEEYIAAREEDGRQFDWPDLAYRARQVADQDSSERRYRHVVIDEGQDFSPEMLKSLARLVPPNGSLTFFGDVAQQIYGRGVSWRSAGLNATNRTYRFKHNYRNTEEIAKLGLAIADMAYFKGDADMVAPSGFRAAGPPPTLVTLPDLGAEADFVVAQATQAADTGSVGILVRRKEDVGRFLSRLQGAQRLHRDMAEWVAGPGISCGTVHAAKGFEFETVLLVGLTAERWPEPRAIEADGEEEAKAMDGRLLYVGITRARQNLIMTTTGDLTELLPPDGELWIDADLDS